MMWLNLQKHKNSRAMIDSFTPSALSEIIIEIHVSLNNLVRGNDLWICAAID